MGYKDYIVPGELPDFGAIFMSNIETKNECFRRKLFGLPSTMSNFVLQVKKGMILFLFEFERRQLFGVFRATSDGEVNIEPNAFKSSGKNFPAQVRFTQIWNCSSLAEHEFKDAIRDNYFSGKKFQFGLSEDQVHKLMMLFAAKRIPKRHPERSFRREGDMPAGEDRRFVDNRKNLVKDRIGFVSEEYEVKEDDVHLDGNFVEKVNNVSYDGRLKYNDDRFLTNYETSDDFGDGGPRQVILGKHLDHSLGGLRSDADAGLRFMDDTTDEREMHTNIVEIRGKRKMKDGYRQIFTEPDGKHFGEIGLENSDARFSMDSIAKRNEGATDEDRIHDEYPGLNSFKRSPCNRGSRTVDDGRFFGHEMVESEQRTLTQHPLNKVKGTTDFGIKPDYDEEFSIRPRKLTPHPMNELRGIKPEYDEEFNIRPRKLNEPRGIKPDYDKDFRFGSVSPTSHNSVGGTNDAAFSLSKQNTLTPISESEDSYVAEQLVHPSNIGRTYDSGYPYSTSHAAPIPYDPEVPHIQLRPWSCFTNGPSSSPVDYHRSYTSSKEILTSESLGSVRYLNDDPGHAFSSKHHNTVSCRETGAIHGNWVFRSKYASMPSRGVESDNRYLAELRSKYASKRLPLFEAGLHPSKEYSIRSDKKHFGRRGSVFSRLTSAPETLKIDIDEKHDLDASVNKVMKMLEKVVSSPIKRTGKGISVFKQKDTTASKTVDDELSKVKIEAEACEVIESGSILEETRLVDFKRRKRSLDDREIKPSCKRRRLVRPVFLRDSTKPVESCEKTVTERQHVQDKNGSTPPTGKRKTCGWLDE